jgi:hypothetical protein
MGLWINWVSFGMSLMGRASGAAERAAFAPTLA